MRSHSAALVFTLAACLPSPSSGADEFSKQTNQVACALENEFSLALERTIPFKELTIYSCRTGFYYPHGCQNVGEMMKYPRGFMISTKRGERAADLLFRAYEKYCQAAIS